MSQENEKQERHLSRADWLRRAGDSSVPGDPPYDDPFSRRAFRGLQYVKDGEEARRSLERLDARIDQLTGTEEPSSSRNIPILWRIAAAVLFLMVIPLSIIWFDAQPVSSQTAFEEHFYVATVSIPNVSPVRDGEPEADTSLLRQAAGLYEKEAFQAANDKFGQYLTIDPTDTAARLYYGISLLAGGQATEALEQLEQIYRTSELSNYTIPAQWYLGMAHLKLGQRAEAITHFRAVANQTQSTFYRDKAEAVLGDIE